MKDEFDVIVIGSGAAGLTCAVVAAQSGLDVLVAEKAAFYGGTTAFSLGAAWIVGNRHQRALGIDDDVNTGDVYLKNTLGNHYDSAKAQAYLHSGAEMVDYMETKTEVRWQGVPMPDYFPDVTGARAGRTMLVKPFDGRTLGPNLRQMRLPLPGFSVFGSMQVDLLESSNYKNTFRNWDGFSFTAGKLLRFWRDRLTHGRGAFLANGNALIAGCFRVSPKRLLRLALMPALDRGRLEQALTHVEGLVRELMRPERRLPVATGQA